MRIACNNVVSRLGKEKLKRNIALQGQVGRGPNPPGAGLSGKLRRIIIKYSLLAWLGLGLTWVSIANAKVQSALSDDQIRQRIIAESLSSYPGNCPCPDNLMSNGRKCGKRSAWSRDGGYRPICYPEEISDEMVKSYRKRFKL